MTTINIAQDSKSNDCQKCLLDSVTCAEMGITNSCSKESPLYDPCKDKTCGERCRVCSSEDVDCLETAVINVCNTEGKCKPDTGAHCKEKQEYQYDIQKSVVNREIFKNTLNKATGGDSKAQYQLAKMYYLGQGTQKSKKKSFEWTKIAVNNGNINVQEYLASMYFNGQGTEKNDEKALYWFEKAAKKGSKTAQDAVASMYYNGQGTLKNYKKAFKWFKKASKQGYAKSHGMLARMYYKQEGVKRNYAKSYEHTLIMMYLNKGKDSNIQRSIDILEKKLSKKEIEKINKKVKKIADKLNKSDL
tara:strand:+ start:16493 stop:17401 length:909 start_codon:yes stop_codon:yes gene_type:complete